MNEDERLEIKSAGVPSEYLDRGISGVAEYVRFLRSQLIGEKARTEYLFEQLERKDS